MRDDSLLSAQYIVILGGSSVNRFDHLTLSSDAAKRVVEGYILHRKTGLPIILSGGSVLKGEEWPSEAEIGTALLLKLGMGSEYIYREEKSRNTFENAHYIKDRFNPKSVVLVTSAYHMKRSVAVFQKLDIPVIPYPVDFKTEDRKYQFLDFLPSMDSLRNSYYAFHEYIGMGYYAIRYLFS